jgi:hypothetical protein
MDMLVRGFLGLGIDLSRVLGFCLFMGLVVTGPTLGDFRQARFTTIDNDRITGAEDEIGRRSTNIPAGRLHDTQD